MMLAAAKADPAWRGHIVNTASMAGLLTPPNMGVYNVTKHAVVSLTETLYQDLGLVTDQVGASVLCPYYVATGIAQSSRNRPQAMLNENAALSRSQQIGRALSEQAVASGDVTAAEIAQKVFDAAVANQFYIFSHTDRMEPVRKRVESILNHTNPPDPFTERPEVGALLRSALREAEKAN
jgi:short-subunit dehydrogenase